MNNEKLIRSDVVSSDAPIKLAILQRVCTGYRIPLFTQLSANQDIDLTLFIGEDIPNSKVRSGAELSDVKARKMKTRFIRLGSRILPWHVGLVSELRKLKPDVILCEGESHFIGYLQAMLYKCMFGRRVALMHWCFISLPGWVIIGGSGHRAKIKQFFRRFFSAFVVYSSYSAECLMKLGQPEEKIFTATNVGNTQQFIKQADLLKESVADAREKLAIPDRFTILYVGTLDSNKRPDVMLDLARVCDSDMFNFVLLGSGDLLEEFRERVIQERLSNVFLPGRVSDELPRYFRAANVFLLPGRGGIAMSEAMAHGLPVIVHQGDGTEYDLVRDEVTGSHLTVGDLNDFKNAIERLQSNPELCRNMGSSGRKLIETCLNTENMVEQIVRASQYARSARKNSLGK